MIPENDGIHYREARQQGGHTLEPFRIKNRNEYLRWEYDLWPKLQTLFNTTWPGMADSENTNFFRDVLQQKDSAAILMKDGNDTIMGVSFVYDISNYKRSMDEISYPKGEKTAYNSSVIIAP